MTCKTKVFKEIEDLPSLRKLKKYICIEYIFLIPAKIVLSFSLKNYFKTKLKEFVARKKKTNLNDKPKTISWNLH